jgi:hypothetical protein
MDLEQVLRGAKKSCCRNKDGHDNMLMEAQQFVPTNDLHSVSLPRKLLSLSQALSDFCQRAFSLAAAKGFGKSAFSFFFFSSSATVQTNHHFNGRLD